MIAIPDLKKLENYYDINQTHANWSFWASLCSVVAGLTTLLIGVFLVYSKNASEAGVVTTVAGVLTEFIAAGFFYLYNKNLKQLNLFYEKLVKLQDTMLAIELVNQLPENIRMNMLETTISMLLTRNEPKSNMSPELIKAYTEAIQSRERTRPS